MKLIRLICVALWAMVAQAAAATQTWNVSYADSSNSFNFIVDGVLQADGDTVVVSSFRDFFHDGVSFGNSLAVFPADPNSGNQPVVSLSRDFGNIRGCFSIICHPVFSIFQNSGFHVYSVFGPAGNDSKILNTALWTMTLDQPPSAIPEPATWAMLIVGFGLVGGLARRRQVIVA